ncbi:FAD-binding protein [Gracilibacillus sp. S3-1-1]|uniref:FAD-binding protein n=1 Tax=Gracilibacillus pellucidus TaxID=3095368 RepID=A0ACC6M0D8_9BACI|nr:FAD-binding protein [Gracilibacillus sp. S3-1-1]MDX8044396.1 FAD-binding protein [Gracilibacillus sp. S3-1-1]
MKKTNWAGNYTYSTTNWHEPGSVEEVQHLVKDCPKLRVIGSRHSFNGIADSNQHIISIKKLNKIIELDKENQTVTVEGGVIYSNLSRYLEEHGFALANLASLPHISVAGACATATHGSGDNNRCLSDSIISMDIVTANGEIVHFSHEKNLEELRGAAVSLGGLGIITKLTLEIIPSYQVSQFVFNDLPFAQLENHLDDILSSAYSVSLFTNWAGDYIHQAWLKKQHVDKEEIVELADLFGALPATANSHPIPGVEAINCTEQMGIPGPWFDRLPHFRIDFTPSNGDELQSEYLVPREYAVKAIAAMREIGEELAPLLHASEIRSIAADELWMSPFYQQDAIGIHLTWKDNWKAVQQVLPKIEKQLKPFNARPHWGKLFTMPKEEVQSLFENLPKFRQLLEQYDPDGKFRNDFLETYIF